MFYARLARAPRVWMQRTATRVTVAMVWPELFGIGYSITRRFLKGAADRLALCVY